MAHFLPIGDPLPGNSAGSSVWIGSGPQVSWVNVNEPSMSFCPAHEVGVNLQIVDGKAVGKCIRCHVPVTVPVIPGGVSELRLQALIDCYLVIAGCPNPARAVVQSKILGDFAQLSRELDAQLLALNAVKVTIARLRRRLGQLAMPVIE